MADIRKLFPKTKRFRMQMGPDKKLEDGSADPNAPAAVPSDVNKRPKPAGTSVKKELRKPQPRPLVVTRNTGFRPGWWCAPAAYLHPYTGDEQEALETGLALGLRPGQAGSWDSVKAMRSGGSVVGPADGSCTWD